MKFGRWTRKVHMLFSKKRKLTIPIALDNLLSPTPEERINNLLFFYDYTGSSNFLIETFEFDGEDIYSYGDNLKEYFLNALSYLRANRHNSILPPEPISQNINSEEEYEVYDPILHLLKLYSD